MNSVLNSSSVLAPVGLAEEAYYRRLWSTPGWESPSPNEDECLRWQAIARLIEGQVLPAWPDPQGLPILDLGCGRGWLTKRLERYGRVVGADPVRASVERARDLFPELPFRVGTPEDLLAELGSGAFALVVASEVIEHVPGPCKQEFMQSVHALVRPGGFAVLTTPRGELWEAWQAEEQEEQPVEQWLTERQLDALARATGFRVAARARVLLPWRAALPARRSLTARCRRLLARWLPGLGGPDPSFYQVVLLHRPLAR